MACSSPCCLLIMGQRREHAMSLKRLGLVLSLSVSILLAGCNITKVSSQSSQPVAVRPGPEANAPDSIRFHIREQSGAARPGIQTKSWLATYAAKGKVARF